MTVQGLVPVLVLEGGLEEELEGVQEVWGEEVQGAGQEEDPSHH